MCEKSKPSKWVIDLTELSEIEQKCLEESYKHLKSVLPKYVGNSPTPLPLDLDEKFEE